MAKKITVFKLDTILKEGATGLTGMLTHWYYGAAGDIRYIFQPKGINPEDGKPVDRIMTDAAWIPEGTPTEEIEIPDEILGSDVMDKASGFKGKAVAFVCHLDGCFHVKVQPPGIVKKTGAPFEQCEFDLRRLEGKMIPVKTEAEVKQSKAEKPSPASTDGVINSKF